MIVYLTRDIPAFVMYCVNGASRSSLLIESTDSMIHPSAVLKLYTVVVIEAPLKLVYSSNGSLTNAQGRKYHNNNIIVFMRC